MVEAERFSPEAEPKEKGVKEEYFRALLEGNTQFPQMDAPINLMVAQRIANDPDYKSLDFAISRLSEDQMARLQQTLGLLHEKYNVRRLVTGEAVQEDAGTERLERVVVQDDALNRIWATTRKNIKNLMYYRDREQLKIVLNILVDELRSDDVQGMAKKFRDALGKIRVKKDKVALVDELYDALIERFDRRLEENEIDPQSAVVGSVYHWTTLTQ